VLNREVVTIADTEVLKPDPTGCDADVTDSGDELEPVGVTDAVEMVTA
jgi:hypothetical protein